MRTENMKKSVLYIAYHYPPIQVSSGLHRTLAFSRALVEAHWGVTVLTASLKAYPAYNESQNRFIPAAVKVVRAFARDTTQYLSFGGKYPDWVVAPDKWHSWILGGVISGLKQIRADRPSLIVSTYPVASAHCIAYFLHKITGIPWIADFRDPMLQDDYPVANSQRRAFAWIEAKAVKHCSHVLFTSPGAVELYRDRYPQAPANFWQLVPNGFDESMFAETLARPHSTDGHSGGRRTLLHSGTIYPDERDPSALFRALGELKAEDPGIVGRWRVLLRATGHDTVFAPMLEREGIGDLVELAPGVDYVAALEEMLEADALLLLQAANCNFQTPAKAYEYLRARRPVLVLTDPAGDTASLMAQTGAAMVAPLDDITAIKTSLLEFFGRVDNDGFDFMTEADIHRYSRQYHAQALVALLEDVVAS